MRWSQQWCKQLILAVVVTAVSVGSAFAQGTTTSSISGTVTDPGGGVIPGATINVTGDAGLAITTITNSEGFFQVPGLSAGAYKVVVTLQGFKTAIFENVRVVSGNPSNLTVKLEVGDLKENITVKSSADLINTQTATVSSTLNADQLNRMPTTSRNALNAVTFLPGVNTPGINRDSTVNGLPESMLNITLDGVSNNDNFNKSSDGFFATVYPRQDAVEAVTVTTAVNGANLGGGGAVTINFTTRSGTNRFSGSAYEYWRDPMLNSNNWINKRNSLPKNDTKLNQYGARAGGPIKIPGVYDGSGKAFYFFHYEELRFPNNFTKTRSIMNPLTLDGTYLYNVTVNGLNVTQAVNLYAIANSAAGIASCQAIAGAGVANPCKSTPDPFTNKLLNLINDSTKKTGNVVPLANPLTMSYNYQSPAALLERQPTGKLDYNLTTKHRLSASMSSIWVSRLPDYLNDIGEQFPGAPNFTNYTSRRPLYSVSMRSTLSANMVNTVKSGFTNLKGYSNFGQPGDPSSGPESFSDIGGYALVIPFTSDWWVDRSPSWRSPPSISIDDELSWQRGKHSLSFGGGWLSTRTWSKASTVVPSVTLNMSTSTCGANPCDPAFNLFSSTTIPGASTGQVNNARTHFAQLTGRITSISNQVALDQDTNLYVPNGPRNSAGGFSTWSAFAQDSWRWTPTLTVTGGLRWDVQTPFTADNDSLSAVTFASVCGMSGPGANTSAFDKCAFFSRQNVGVTPEYVQLLSSTKGYNTDWNNLAPSVGVAWRPNVQGGFLRKILGDPEQATLRGGYSVSYERQGLGVFTGLYGSNPGGTLTITRNTSNGNLVNAGETWPLLYSDKNRLYNASFPETVKYPIAVRANRADSLTAFAPDVHIANARSWTMGFQRSITRDMAVDVRYVGTRGVDQWSALNYNARDLESNGFLQEFKLAVANLKANNEAGGTRVGSFAYFGAGTGTNPLPTYFAYLLGPAGGSAANAANYTGTLWTNTGITGDMIFLNPSPGNSAADLDGDAVRRANAIAAGYPANYFVLNPVVGTDSVTDSGAFSDYHALQIDLRRRLSQGLSANINYQYAREGGSAFDGFKYGRQMVASGNVRHAIKTQWDWTIPVGRGQRYLTDANGLVDAIAGGWSFTGVGRFQARALDFGNVRLVGMSAGELQSEYHYTIKPDPASGLLRAYMLPEDIVLNTRRAFSLSTSNASGYSTSLGVPEGRYIAPANYPGCIQIVAGDCAPRNLMIRAPWFARVDVGAQKRFSLKGSSNIEVAVQVLNLLDNVNFNPVANPGTDATIFSTTSIYMDSSNTYDPGGRLGQVMFRINW